jgi:hypothetical protein
MYLHGLSEAAVRVFEIRAFAGGRTHSGYFDNIDFATEAAFRLTSRPDCSAVYVTLNPCNPALLEKDLPASPTDPQVLFPPALSLAGEARSLCEQAGRKHSVITHGSPRTVW